VLFISLIVGRKPKFELQLKYNIRGGENMSYGGSCGFGGGFALLVVLFILLIIVGCSCWGGGY
ncbi:hypothetical protein BK708_10575, partial [Bacillus thuringiensis serovar yunnanensis]